MRTSSRSIARAAAARRAQALWAAAEPARADHPYLARKCVKPTSTLRELAAAKARETLGYAPRSARAVLDGRVLIVPVMIDGEISTVEMIDEAGHKAFLAGGAVKSGVWDAGALPAGAGEGLTVLIGEGIATVLSACEASGHVGVAALSAGNLYSAAIPLTMRLPKARLVFLVDLDKNGIGLKAAEQAAGAVGGLIAVPDFGETRPADAKDFNDLAVLLGHEVVREAIASARPPAADYADDEPADSEVVDDGAEIERLAKLAPVARDRELRAAAKRLGCRVGTLEAAVKTARGEAAAAGQGRPLELPEPDPWQNPVGGASLLDEMARVIRSHIVMGDGLAETVALWVLAAHAIDAFVIFARLVLTSPERRCGKTTSLFIISRLVPRRLLAASATTASIFRAIEMARPTILLDEADAFLSENEELRGILNAGHTREGMVLRTVGDAHEPRQFSVWAAMAIAAIGRLPATLEDRAVTIGLRRRRQDERVEDCRADRTEALDRLARMAARWAADHVDALAKADPVVPDSIFNRAADNWRPLLAVADAAGGRWPALARRIAETMVVADGGEDGSRRVALLNDVRAIFESEDLEQMASEYLVKRLVEKEGAPWAEWGKSGKPISKHALARLLKPLGVRPADIWTGDQDLKGYRRDQFADAWERYLPSQTARPRGMAENCGAQDDTEPRGSDFPRGLETGGEAQDSAIPRGLAVQIAVSRFRTVVGTKLLPWLTSTTSRFAPRLCHDWRAALL